MPKVFTSETQKIGEFGENIAIRFLMKHGFSIKERNYTRKWGEIDIIAEKHNKLHFIEVKSVSHETLSYVIHETPDDYRPEDNMHPWKMKRMARTIQTYFIDKNIEDSREWQADLLTVYIDIKNKKAIVKTIKDIVL